MKYFDLDSKPNFWRTVQKQEIDYLEVMQDEIYAYEIKWNPKNKLKIPKIFRDNYQVNEFKLVNKDNFEEILSKQQSN